ncbi:MAG: sigma-54 dependent transcriptional regulator [gamma proteobacterium symbiont of Bathyaustriella thionipta]|nr:sigma-54 dependent transcriptional regulator [gamma proteobacterium symbiont of Bathyaustriella thionipta]
MANARILVVDDEADIRQLVSDILQDEGYKVSMAEDGNKARRALKDSKPDLILLDIWMPDLDGISLLKEWAENDNLPCPVIMMSGHGTVETAVEATRLGAYDFLEKPLSLAKLLLTVERGLEAEKLQQENSGLRRHVDLVVEPVGKSSTMQRLREQTKRIAQHDSWVLISGEPGSGRETLARYLHAQSHRHEMPFVDMPASALARDNAAREMLGSEEGEQVQYGALEKARGGTLYLDEVADMSDFAQKQLLGVLDSGSFMRIGGADSVALETRIIAATQKNLELEVQAGRFREDLFFHLNVVPLSVPPLREHAEDVPELLEYYVDYFVTHERLSYRHFSVGAQNYLRNHLWPGNILELKNLVQRMLITGSGEQISQEELESAIGNSSGKVINGVECDISFEQPLRDAREQFERAYLEYQFKKSNGNVSKLARVSGMERTHLYRKLRALGIEIKDRRV